jgi:peptidoglycan-associated lipoprotein
MAHTKLRLSLAIVVAMTVLAGCSSNKNADSGANSGANSGLNGSSSSSGSAYGDGSNGSGSDYAESGRVVYFDFDSYNLSAEGQATVDRNLATLKSGSQHIRLEGHADERGTREYNLALGERRASAVAQYLEANGVSKSRIEMISYGKERPADLGHDESAWSKNRRVEIVLN